MQFDRKDMLLALGGGVVGDITGFVADFLKCFKISLMDFIDVVNQPFIELHILYQSICDKRGDFGRNK